MTKVSIITASYNYENYIKETIESVLAQTIQDWEMIIVDDGSTDNSVNVIKEYCKKDKRIKFYQHDKNKGLAETLKLAISKASSDWLAFLESDDTITPDYVEEKLHVIQKYPNIKFIFNDVKMFGDKDVINTYNEHFYKVYKTFNELTFPIKLTEYLVHFNYIATFSTVMLKKEILYNLDWNSPLKKCIDYYLWSQLANKYEFYYIDKKLTNWRMSPNSYIRQTSRFDKINDIIFTAKIHSNLVCNKFPLFKNADTFLRILNAIRKCIIAIHLGKSEKKIRFFGKNIFRIYKADLRHDVWSIFGLNFIINRKFIHKSKNIQLIEKSFIEKSEFWDAKWYINRYHPEFNPKQALDYWYKKGWLKNERPSKYIDENYIDFCFDCNSNPIIYYTGKNKIQTCYVNTKNAYKTDQDKIKIAEYLEYKKTRKAKGVVYTCITNDYDEIREIETYKYIDEDWDYVCFTDNNYDITQGQIGIWDIRPLQFSELDNTRNQRWHKTNPHMLFPEYDQSCWIDGNINIISDTLFKNIYSRNYKLLVTKHFKNTCIFQEYGDVTTAKLDNPTLIEAEKQIIVNDNMPKNWGMPETNILYRKHNDKQIINFDEKWWEMIEKYSKRDQLSASYLMWKAGIDPDICFMENSRYAVYDFYVFNHKKDRE